MLAHSFAGSNIIGEIFDRVLAMGNDVVSVSSKLRNFLKWMLQLKAKERYANSQAAKDLSPRIKRLPTVQSRRVFLNGLGLLGLTVGSGSVVGCLVKAGKNDKLSLPRSYKFETVKLNDQGGIISRQPMEGKLFVQEIADGISLNMVSIPAGKFLMGSPESEKDRSKDEGPQHEVSVPGFFMGQTPITQAQWRSVATLPKVNIDMNAEPSRFKGDRRPVEQVSWSEAQEFCDRLSRLTQTQTTYRLPSEAEWEYACRSGTTTPFYFGETITTEVANYNGNYAYGNGPKGKESQQTTDVATYPANAWGLYDMHGNVWEWCADHYWRENYQGAPIDGSVWNASNDSGSKFRSLRGGSRLNIPHLCRSASRKYDAPSYRYYGFGFRVVCLSSSPG